MNPTSWEDMSDFVVHFAKESQGHKAYDTVMSICSNRQLRAKGKFGIAKGTAPSGADQRAVCFSEIPPGHWDRLIERRKTKYGVAFTKQFLIENGAGPIWYAWKDTPHWNALQQLMGEAESDPDSPIWSITPLIDAPGIYGGKKYLFDWEREWRHVGTLNFHQDDVAFLLIPEELHAAAHAFFLDAQ